MLNRKLSIKYLFFIKKHINTINVLNMVTNKIHKLYSHRHIGFTKRQLENSLGMFATLHRKLHVSNEGFVSRLTANVSGN